MRRCSRICRSRFWLGRAAAVSFSPGPQNAAFAVERPDRAVDRRRRRGRPPARYRRRRTARRWNRTGLVPDLAGCPRQLCRFLPPGAPARLKTRPLRRVHRCAGAPISAVSPSAESAMLRPKCSCAASPVTVSFSPAGSSRIPSGEHPRRAAAARVVGSADQRVVAVRGERDARPKRPLPALFGRS